MSEAWKIFPGAPAPGVAVCPLDEITNPGAKCLVLSGFPILLMRRAGSVWAFVNSCPHQDLPLNYRGETVLSANGATLLCTVHGACFGAETGRGTTGPASGAGLDPVPVCADPAGMIRIAAS